MMSETRTARLDDRLVRALDEGTAVLPEDPGRLLGYLRTIELLLAEKAQMHEPRWQLVLASAAEIEVLQDLEALVVEKAIELPSRTLRAVAGKLAIWAELDPEGEDAPAVPQRDRLVASVRGDIERIARIAERRSGKIGLL